MSSFGGILLASLNKKPPLHPPKEGDKKPKNYNVAKAGNILTSKPSAKADGNGYNTNACLINWQQWIAKSLLPFTSVNGLEFGFN